MAGLADAVLWLPKDTYSGAGDWLDISGNSHDASLTNAVWNAGGYFTNDGLARAFDITDHADLDFAAAESFTWMFAVKPTSVAASCMLLYKADPSPGYYVQLFGGDDPTFVIHDGVASPNVAGATVTVNELVVVTVVRDVAADDLEVFVDGVPSGSPTTDSTTATLANADPVYLGGRWGDQFMTGEWHAVACWRSALSDADVVSASAELLGVSTMTLLGVG